MAGVGPLLDGAAGFRVDAYASASNNGLSPLHHQYSMAEGERNKFTESGKTRASSAKPPAWDPPAMVRRWDASVKRTFWEGPTEGRLRLSMGIGRRGPGAGADATRILHLCVSCLVPHEDGGAGAIDHGRLGEGALKTAGCDGRCHPISQRRSVWKQGIRRLASCIKLACLRIIPQRRYFSECSIAARGPQLLPVEGKLSQSAHLLR